MSKYTEKQFSDKMRKAYFAKKAEKEKTVDKLPRITGRTSLGGLGYHNMNMYKNMVEKLNDKVIEKDFDAPVKHSLYYETDDSDLKEIDRFHVKNRINTLEEAHKVTSTPNSKHWLKFLKKYNNQFS